MNQKTELETILRTNGYSITKPRQLLFTALTGHEPLSMHELYERVKGQIDRASVYRIITTFEQIGIVQRINIGWKYKIELSDKFAEHHHHLTCLHCHKVIPINEAKLESFIKYFTSNLQFKPVEHQVEVQGYCESCQ